MNHALAFDEHRNRLVLFAGANAERLRDLWEWDPQAGVWTNRTPNPLRGSWPEPHFGHAMVYDADRRRCVVFGGTTPAGVVDETWEWDGAAGTWQRRTGFMRPPALGAHAMTYDLGRRKVVLFGGFDNRINNPTNQVWEWDGREGTWTNRIPGWPWPPAHSGASLVYDGARSRSVLFGGFNNVPGGHNAEVWEWDGATGTWMNRTPASLPAQWPSARANHAAAYDPKRGRMFLFGGARGDLILADAWEWDGATGTFVDRTPNAASEPAPDARVTHAMAYVGSRASVVMFGGCCFNSNLWEWAPPP
jgi:hypothetical protein